jgi:hypothetical protein
MAPIVTMQPVVQLAGALAALAGFPQGAAITLLAMDARDWASSRRERIGGASGDRRSPSGTPSPAIGGRTLDAVDFGVIEVLRGLEVRRPGTLKRLVGTFVAKAPECLAQMEESVATADWQTLERLAHDMKSDSGNLGARRLSALCDDLQTAARDGAGPERCVELVPRIEAEFGSVREALRSAGLVG